MDYLRVPFKKLTVFTQKNAFKPDNLLQKPITGFNVSKLYFFKSK